jgi:hypothetical protein
MALDRLPNITMIGPKTSSTMNRSNRFTIHTLVSMVTRAAWSAGETALT